MMIFWEILFGVVGFAILAKFILFFVRSFGKSLVKTTDVFKKLK